MYAFTYMFRTTLCLHSMFRTLSDITQAKFLSKGKISLNYYLLGFFFFLNLHGSQTYQFQHAKLNKLLSPPEKHFILHFLFC